MLRLISTGQAETAVQVIRILGNITNKALSLQTIRLHLKKAGMKSAVKKKRPLLTARHSKERLDYALKHQYWTLEDWKKVVWSDETKVNRLGSDGRKWMWKKQGEGLSNRVVEGTVKFGGGSVMVWGCMLWDGMGYAARIDGKMDAELYCQILDDDLRASLDYYDKSQGSFLIFFIILSNCFVGDVIFQQDNDPKHISKLAKKWFVDHGIEVMKWPPQSPDLNPIEHLWCQIKKQLAGYETPPSGMLELWERIEKEWDAIPSSVCQNLIESMPRRVEAVLKAKGGYTKY